MSIAFSSPTSGASGASSSINYITNPNAEGDTSGWNLYNDAAAVPVNGAGASSITATFAVTATTPLRGAQSFLYLPGGLGNGVATPFTISRADQGKLLQINFDMSIGGTGFTDGALQVYIYDVTNSSLIYPATLSILNTLTTSFFKTTFQTSISSTSYRLLIHQTNAVSTYNLKFDNVVLGPQIASVGSYAGGWRAYQMAITSTGATPGLGTTTVNSALYRQVGDTCEISYNLNQTVAGTVGSGSYLFALPTGLTAATTLITPDTNFATSVSGEGYARFSTNNASLSVHLYDSTRFGLRIVSNISDAGASAAIGVMIGAANYPLTQANITYSFIARIPIAGWASSQVLSSDGGDGRVCAAYVSTITSTLTASTWTDVKMSGVGWDSHGGYSPATGIYTCQVSGFYQVNGNAEINGTMGSGGLEGVRILKAISGSFGAIFSNAVRIAATSSSCTYSAGGTVWANAGDSFKLQAYSDRASPVFSVLSSAPAFTIARMAGPNQIAASERVYLEVSNITALPIGTSATDMVFSTVISNSHGIYNASTGEVTAPRSDWYNFSYVLITGGITVTTANYFFSRISKKPVGGAYAVYRGEVIKNGNGATTVQYAIQDSGGLYLQAGDMIKVQAYNPSGATTLGTNFASKLSVSTGGV